MMPKQLLSLFAFDEFQVIISGTQLEIDVTDWHLNTVYHGGFSEEHKTVAYFWNFLQACSPDERAAILAFSTGYSRAPLFGFSSLTPKFCLCLDVQGSDDHLPTASTCANLLKIPAYSSYEILSSKCRYIISEKPGFHLQ